MYEKVDERIFLFKNEKISYIFLYIESKFMFII